MVKVVESPASWNRTFCKQICLFVILVISHFGFEARILVLIVLFSGHCCSFTFEIAGIQMRIVIPHR